MCNIIFSHKNSNFGAANISSHGWFHISAFVSYICIMTHRNDISPTDAAPHTTLRISNMVCPRCIMAVRALLAGEGYVRADVSLGSATVEGVIPAAKIESIRRRLEEIGFALIDDPREELAERLRMVVIELARGGRMKHNLSEEIVSRIGHDYSSLSKLFTSTYGYTIERYFILQKIERAKELLQDSAMPLGEIAERLGYSSTAYLSAQFKSVEGRTPTDFRRDSTARRKTIDTI